MEPEPSAERPGGSESQSTGDGQGARSERLGTLEVAALLGALALMTADSIRLILAGPGLPPATVTGLPLDDAFIHLDYARSIVKSGVFGYNPGVWENGSTAPLWSVLLALPMAFGLTGVLATKTLGILSTGLLLLQFWLLARHIGGAGLASIAVLALALEPWTSVLAVSGMETQLAAAMAMAAWLCARSAWWWRCGLALAAAGLLRPELALLVPAALLLAPAWPQRLRVALPPLLAGTGWMAFGMAVAGSPVPNAFRTKVHLGFDPLGQLASIGGLFSAMPRELGPLGWLPLLGALALCVLGLLSLRSSRRALGFAVLTPLALLTFYLLAVPLGASADPLTQASVQSIYFARYLLIVLPWCVLWAALGWCHAFGRAPVGLARHALLVAGLVILVAVAWTERRDLTAAYVANTAEIEELHGKTARWITGHLPPDAVVGVSDAGRIRFGIGQKVIDLRGLNSSELIGLEDPVPALLEAGLTHAAIWPQWHGGLEGPGTYDNLVKDSRLEWTELGGARVENNTVAAHQVMVLYAVRPAPEFRSKPPPASQQDGAPD
ncbi:MAG: hypothetical protein VX498_11885 [Myxococcota bacterium]|nr:hypothetical protein [Myxococcota bacterium]